MVDQVNQNHQTTIKYFLKDKQYHRFYGVNKQESWLVCWNYVAIAY